MENKARVNTSYCGLYCPDCIPSNEELFSLIDKLEKTLEELQFEKYAELINKKYNRINNYNVFKDVLKEIKKLQCKNKCYLGPESEIGCKSDCKIRKCAIQKHFNGCWECNDFKRCDLISQMKKNHPAIIKNLEAIKNNGIDNWINKRGKHYNWSVR